MKALRAGGQRWAQGVPGQLTRAGLALAIAIWCPPAAAERLWTCGFELQTTRSGVETEPGISPSGATFIDATPVHGGLAVARAVAVPGQRSSFRGYFESATPAIYARAYVRLEAPVNAKSMFLLVRRSSAVPALVLLSVDSAGWVHPQVWASTLPATVRLTVGQWHRFEILVDERGPSGAHTVQIAIDGVTFVLLQSLSLTHVPDTLEVGLNVNAEGASSGVMLFDDLAVNGTGGSAQNGFPPPGRVFLMRPNGAGPAPMWTPQDGGIASVENWRDLSELPPDDGVTALESLTNASALDEVELEPPPPEAFGTAVNLVTTGVRFGGGGTTQRSLALVIRSSASGVSLRSANLPANALGWFTNRVDGYFNDPLVAYLSPEGPPWTGALLDTMRLALLDGDSVARQIQVSAIWAQAELAAPLEPPSPVVGQGADAGVPDGGSWTDAGTRDAGLMGDGGTMVDAGLNPDGGPPDEAGQADAGAEDAGRSTSGDAGLEWGRPLHLEVGCGCGASRPRSFWALLIALVALFARASGWKPRRGSWKG